ncbi:MAG: glycogen synthase [Candidatus Bathyarchaeia archaeon]
MKVTLLTWEYPPHVYGGAGVHVKYLTRALSRWIDVEVRTLHAIGEKEHHGVTTEEEGVKVKRFDPWPLLQEGCEPKFKSLFNAFSTDLALVKDPIDSDIVHTHTWYTSLAGFFAKKLYDVKLVATVHSLEPKRPWKRESMGNAYNLSTWAERVCLNACDRVVAVSMEDKKDIIECYGIQVGRIAVIPNGIDIERYRSREDPAVLEKYGVGKPYVLFLGRLSRQKGVFDVVEASSKLPKGVRVVIVTGKADDRSIERDLAHEVEGKKNIVWINRMLSVDEAIALYSSAEIFTAPSVYEPFGLINLEAMACGRPVVSTRVGGIKDVVVDGETGLLIPPQSPKRLAEALNRLLSDRELAEEMGRRGRERVERFFGWERVAEKTLELYRSLL